MRIANRTFAMLFGLAAAATVACSSATDPRESDILQGRWEGFSTTGVAYIYIFEATGENSPNPRTGNVARSYSLQYSTTPGASGSVAAWYEAYDAYWGGSSLGTIVDDSTMTVQSDGVAPFIMRKR
jgi:hypothetical protein